MVFIVYDIEATCWENQPPGAVQETIEIGAFKINPYGEVLGTFNRFIKPVIHDRLSYYCMQLTTIEQSQINRADSFVHVIESFQDWAEVFENDYVLCSWGNFDKILLQQDCVLHDIEDDWLENHINIKQQYHHFRDLRKPAGLKKTVEREGFEFTGTLHRGIDDAENLAKVFIKHLDEWQY